MIHQLNYLPWHTTEASCLWLQEYPSIPLRGHSHTLSSLPVQFRSLMWMGHTPSVYWPVSGMAPVEKMCTLCQCRIDNSCYVRFSTHGLCSFLYFNNKQSAIIIKRQEIIPYGEYPSCLHTTLASLLFQKSSQMVPQVPLTHTSTLPNLL